MKSVRRLFGLLLLPLAFSTASVSASEAANQWRAEHRFIDLHQHIAYEPDKLERCVRIMDASGIGIGVDLSGGYTTARAGTVSAFQKNKELADRLYPGRFIHYMNLDYAKWSDPDFSADAVRQVEEGHRLGAAGLKQEKSLGLYLRDKDGALIKIDDAKLDPVWKRCGELNMPISIHVADPAAFMLTFHPKNQPLK
jgi:predicted TIM-barrel fold metal-dependent hydrolase